MSDLIKNVRLNLSKHGNSELEIVANDEYLQDLFKQKQDLINEMSAAKRRAADEAAQPYLDAISEVDKVYSMMLTLMSDNRG